MTYVLIKLTTGEQLMAQFAAEDDTHIAVSHPMLLRMIPQAIDGRISEHVTATPFCHFADGDDFVFPKTSIMFIKPLKPSIIPHYENVVKEHEKVAFHPNEKRKIRWAGEEEEITLEEINRRMDMLQEIINGERKEEAEAEDKKTFVEGNDTLH